MNNEKSNLLINQLATDAKNALGTNYFDEKFTDLYEVVLERWRSSGVLDSLSFKYKFEYDEVLSMSLNKILHCLERYKTEETHFYNFLSSSISNECVDEVRRRRKKIEEEMVPNYIAMEDDPNLNKFIPHANADNEDFDDYVKESEQRQLLTQLLGKADDKCRQAVEALLESKSYNDAAKKLGISNHAVKRRVQKVAKLFDTSIYGDIHDYFTVPTTPSNQLVSQPEVSAS